MLSKKTALVTGGARGIGFAIAKELITQETKVVICSRTQSDLQKALITLNRKGKVAYGTICDVSKLADCKKLIEFSFNSLPL